MFLIKTNYIPVGNLTASLLSGCAYVTVSYIYIYIYIIHTHILGIYHTICLKYTYNTQNFVSGKVTSDA